MNNREAIKILKDMMSDIFVPTSDEQDEALDLAIDALEYVEQISRMCGADKGEEE